MNKYEEVIRTQTETIKTVECSECEGTGEFQCQHESHFIDSMSSHECLGGMCFYCGGEGSVENTETLTEDETIKSAVESHGQIRG